MYYDMPTGREEEEAKTAEERERMGQGRGDQSGDQASRKPDSDTKKQSSGSRNSGSDNE